MFALKVQLRPLPDLPTSAPPSTTITASSRTATTSAAAEHLPSRWASLLLGRVSQHVFNDPSTTCSHVHLTEVDGSGHWLFFHTRSTPTTATSTTLGHDLLLTTLRCQSTEIRFEEVDRKAAKEIPVCSHPVVNTGTGRCCPPSLCLLLPPELLCTAGAQAVRAWMEAMEHAVRLGRIDGMLAVESSRLGCREVTPQKLAASLGGWESYVARRSDDGLFASGWLPSPLHATTTTTTESPTRRFLRISLKVLWDTSYFVGSCVDSTKLDAGVRMVDGLLMAPELTSSIQRAFFNMGLTARITKTQPHPSDALYGYQGSILLSPPGFEGEGVNVEEEEEEEERGGIQLVLSIRSLHHHLPATNATTAMLEGYPQQLLKDASTLLSEVVHNVISDKTMTDVLSRTIWGPQQRRCDLCAALPSMVDPIASILLGSQSAATHRRIVQLGLLTAEGGGSSSSRHTGTTSSSSTVGPSDQPKDTANCVPKKKSALLKLSLEKRFLQRCPTHNNSDAD